MDYSGNSELIALEHGAPKYNKMLVRRFAAALPKSLDKEVVTLDFGAGIGALSRLWVDEGMGSIHCYEPDTGQCKQIVARGLKGFSDLEELPRKYDLVFSSNVLEHIENDEGALREIREKVIDKNGALVLYVPAFQLLYSKMDEKVGHHRRYSRRSLLRVVKKSGFEIEYCEYVDSVGFLAALIFRLLKFDGEVATSTLALRIYDNIVLPVSLLFDRLGLKRLLGKNLICVAKIRED